LLPGGVPPTPGSIRAAGAGDGLPTIGNALNFARTCSAEDRRTCRNPREIAVATAICWALGYGLGVGASRAVTAGRFLASPDVVNDPAAATGRLRPDRHRLEELVRYCARPPLANDRLTKRPDGRYARHLKSRWRDGTTHLCFEPIELLERLTAQIPKARINLVLYAGVLAPNAKLRKQVVGYGRPVPERPATETQTRAERECWAELMRVTFDLDVLACPRCGGRLRHIATILDARVARRILEHLKLPARAPPEAPARMRPPFWSSAELG
jgi:hypothetical protein